jgi:hypothetical protein
MTVFPRLLGALTAAYGVGLIARPALLAMPCDLADAVCLGLGLPDQRARQKAAVAGL